MTSVRRKITTSPSPAIVVGGGLAGMFTALRIAAHRDVVLVTKGAIGEGSTAWAQGGIAAAVGADDTVAAHVLDTLEAGAGLVDPDVARAVCTDGPARIADLAALGVTFDRVGDHLALAREGAHSRSRVVHAGGDATGRHVAGALVAAVRAEPRIRVADRTRVLDLLTDDRGIRGVTLRGPAGDESLCTRVVVLATGGAGHMFSRTTNPLGATADGPALARRAGAALADMEMVQFHPTALAVGASPLPLISEAVRGAGGVLRDVHGRAVMDGVHPLGDLGPRDVVAREVWRRARDTGADVVMDLSHLDPGKVHARFPAVAALCAAHGIDLARDPVPVTPAAHYAMGGILSDLAGRSTVPGLWAVGECAATGLHGANRLASNSLLEAVALAERAAADVVAGGGPAPGPRAEPVAAITGHADAEHVRNEVGLLMWHGCGLERDARELGNTLDALHAVPAPADPEAAGLLEIARLTVRAAAERDESRGAHFRTDFTSADPARAHRIAWAGDLPHHLDAAGHGLATTITETA
jgi:L-aspartate oxidase